MNVAVLGGGTAGFMAAAHLTSYFPDLQLYHIYDTRIPSIGVGEGTTPPFARWIHETTRLDFSDLQAQCQVTRKVGIQFENWGVQHARYAHYFSPAHEGFAYHISAAGLVALLRQYVAATHLDRKVMGVESRPLHVRITFENRTHLDVDLVIDARGFPQTLGGTHLSLSCIPTNAALIRRGPAVDALPATRAVARPHGWIFVIPLTTSTSYGYIYNGEITTCTEIEADFNDFLHGERVHVLGPDKWLRFPNFTCRTFFDGGVFRIGNAAAFLEPLEATGLTIILEQLRIVSFWLLDELLGVSKRGRSEQCLAILNDHLLDFVHKAALFVSWHYARGSRFQTPFWQFARSCFVRSLDGLRHQAIFSEFERFLQAGARLPAALAFVKAPEDLDAIAVPETPPPSAFGGFLDVSFAKVGYGMDYFSGADERD